MRVMVTGGCGFVGSRLVEALHASGHEVYVLDAGLQEVPERWAGRVGIEYMHGDVRDTARLTGILEHCGALVHLAANALIRGRDDRFADDAARGALETVSVVEAVRKSGCARVVFASSMTVYGDREDVCRESDGLRPISAYAATKCFGEALLNVLASSDDRTVVVFRLGIVLGAGLTRGVVYDFVNRLGENPHKLTMLGNGAQEKAYVHLDDVLRAIEGVGLDPAVRGYQVYNLAAVPTLSVRRIAEVVAEELGVEPEIVGTDTTGGWRGDVRRAVPDISSLAATGRGPRVSPEDAVRRMVRSMAQRPTLG